MSGGLDFASGVAVLWLTIALSAVHVLTSPSREFWVHLPSYVRLSLAAAVIVCLFRGVELIALSRELQPDAPGHASALEFLFVFGLNTLANGALVFILARTYPPEVWRRIRILRALLDGEPQSPAERKVADEMMTKPARDLLDQSGVYVVPARFERMARR